MPQPLPPHVEWLVDSRGDGLRRALHVGRVDTEVRDALGVLVDADPSPGAHAVQWLVDTYLASGYRWEDVRSGQGSRVHQTLSRFGQHRRRLPPGSRQLSDHASLASLDAALARLAPAGVDGQVPLVGRALRRQARAQAYDSSLVLYQSADLIVAVPMTRRAACWWGLGTQWCTAADQDNMFAEYHSSAPLIVVVLPGVEEGKLQLHMDSDNEDIQFMDVHDRPVSKKFIAKHWDRLGGLLLWAATQDMSMLDLVPKSVLTRQVCLELVHRAGHFLDLLPARMRSQEVCIQAVLDAPDTFYSLPPNRVQPRLLHAMIAKYPLALEMVDEDDMTRQLCIQAVDLDGQALMFVPQHLRDLDMCLVAIQTCGQALALFDPADITAEVCRDAIGMDGMALQHVPRHLATRQLCLAAIERDGQALRWVADRMVDSTLCRLALAGDSLALDHVPARLCTRQMCLDSVSRHERAITFVPEHLDTDEVRMASVRAHGQSIRYIEWHHRHPELIRAALDQDPRAFVHLASRHMDARMCAMAVAHDAQYFCLVPDKLQTHDMCLQAVAKCGRNLAHVREEYRTLQVCIAACLDDACGCAYLSVPAHLRPQVGKSLLEHQQALDGQGHGHDSTPEHSWNPDTYFEGLLDSIQGYPGIQAAPSAVPSVQVSAPARQV